MKPRLRMQQQQDPPANMPMRYEQRKRIKEVVRRYQELAAEDPQELTRWLSYVAQLPTYQRVMNMNTGVWEEEYE